MEITGLSGIEVRELTIIPPPNYAPVDGSAIFVGLQSKQTPLIPTAKITVSTTPYTVDGDNYFLTYTNRDSVDLFKSVTARYRGRSSAGSTSQYVKFDLTPTGLTTKATLRGRINFSEDNAINGGTPSEQGTYFRVYDSNNRKLIEIYTFMETPISYVPILIQLAVALGFVVTTIFATHILGPKRKSKKKLAELLDSL